MRRPDILTQLPRNPTRRTIAQAARAAWEPEARDLEIARLRDEEGLSNAAIAKQIGVSYQRVNYLYRRYKIRMECVCQGKSGF
jgi:predicted DNA-binding protein (UPF0251 family)